jgi:hypothetical protein
VTIEDEVVDRRAVIVGRVAGERRGVGVQAPVEVEDRAADALAGIRGGGRPPSAALPVRVELTISRSPCMAKIAPPSPAPAPPAVALPVPPPKPAPPPKSSVRANSLVKKSKKGSGQ